MTNSTSDKRTAKIVPSGQDKSPKLSVKEQYYQNMVKRMGGEEKVPAYFKVFYRRK